MFTVVVLPNVETAIFRSVGDTKVPLKTLVVSGIINVILNLLFVIVLKMTVNGVAIAIVISNLISAIILLNKSRSLSRSVIVKSPPKVVSF